MGSYSNRESLSSPTPERLGENETFCLFLPGALATRKGVVGLKIALESFYGQENTTVVNSAFSFDLPDRQRFSKMANRLIEERALGKRISLIAHSFGPVEMGRIFDEIMTREPAFFSPENIKDLDIVLIGPVGFFEGFSGAVSFLKRFGITINSQLNLAPFNWIPSSLRGIESTNLVSPEGIDKDNLISTLREVLPQLSQYREEFTQIEFSPMRDYRSQLSQDESLALDKIDNQITQTIKKQNWARFKKLLKQRGQLLSFHLGRAYSGQYFDEEEVPTEEQITLRQALKLYGQSLLGMSSLLKDMFSGKPLRLINSLKRKGARVIFFVPEFDVVVRSDEVISFFNLSKEEITSFVCLLAGYTHASFAFQPEVLKKTLEEIEKSFEETTN